MSDPTLKTMRREISEERAAKAEAARIERKVSLLRSLASSADSIERDLESLKIRKDRLKTAKRLIKSVENFEDLTAEDITDLLNEVGSLQRGEECCMSESLHTGGMIPAAAIRNIVFNEFPRQEAIFRRS